MPEGNRNFKSFKNWWEFVSAAEKSECTIPGFERASRKPDSGDGWYGHTSWDKTLLLARQGWKEGAQRITEQTGELTEEVAAKLAIVNFNYDFVPGNLDVARYLEGEPECYLFPEEVISENLSRGGRGFITAVINTSVSGAVSSQSIMSKGIAVGAAINLLQLSGYGVRVELWFVSKPYGRAGEGDDIAVETKVILKDFDESLDLDRLAFAIGHPATFRRLAFAIWEGCPDFTAIKYGYGLPSPVPEGHRGNLYIGENVFDRWGSTWTPKEMNTWTRATLKEQGIELRKE